MGSVMSYALGLGPDRPAPAGILAFSGFVPAVEGWEPDLAGRPARACSSPTAARDPVMEVGFARRARELLEDGGLDVEYHEGAYGHWIEPADLAAATAWLA